MKCRSCQDGQIRALMLYLCITVSLPARCCGQQAGTRQTHSALQAALQAGAAKAAAHARVGARLRIEVSSRHSRSTSMSSCRALSAMAAAPASVAGGAT